VARLLVGRWRVVQRQEPPRGIAENLLVRTSDLTGVRQWRWMTFSPPQSLILSDGTHTTRLQYAAENGDIDLAPEGQHLDHDDWQVMFTAGMLYLRSLADDTTLVLIRDPSAPGR